MKVPARLLPASLSVLSATLFSVLSACAQQAAVDGLQERELAYVASVRGQVYYWAGCDNWRSLPPANLVWFETPTEAEQAGYTGSTARGCAGPERRSGESPVTTGVCTVERVVDGDTVVCAEAAERIRLLLIDAPELSQGEAGGRAREALLQMLPVGGRARVELDVQERDRYGRILAYLYDEEGRMVNEELLRQGYGVVSVFPPNVRHVARLREAAMDAREANRGLWSEGGFACAPIDHRQGRCP